MMATDELVCERCGQHGHVYAAHCDDCGQLIRSEAQLARYEDLGVDWALCGHCGRDVDSETGLDSSGSRRCDDLDPQHRHHIIEKQS